MVRLMRHLYDDREYATLKKITHTHKLLCFFELVSNVKQMCLICVIFHMLIIFRRKNAHELIHT